MKYYKWYSPIAESFLVVSEEEINAMIDEWHFTDGCLDYKLYEYMGMSEEDYSIWTTKPSNFLVEDI